MSIPPLTLIPAGAGSGKTYTLQTRLADWVASGAVAPERIVAVTFTKAAASELRNRIRGELVSAGRIEDSLKLDRAYISTIHSFGLRLLTEFAFEAGSTPSPRQVNEDEQDVLIRLVLARTDKADNVLHELESFGYKYDGGKKTTGETQFRNDVTDLISLLRTVELLPGDTRLAQHLEDRIRKLYGPTQDGKALTQALLKAVKQLLKEFPDSLAGIVSNETARKALFNDFGNLKRAAEGQPLDFDWGLWQDLRDLRPSKRGSPLPEGYDERAQAVMVAADVLPCHPGPLETALGQYGSMLNAALDTLHRYGDEKKAAGLLDYTDMLAQSYGLLKTFPDVLHALRDRVDCLVIDEFQDTNPVQFALLWGLQTAGIPALVVGDLKQAIMGFQGADPQLMEQLIAQNPNAVDPLRANWRSVPALMDWINPIGLGLFGKDYVELKPKADFKSKLTPLEVVDIPFKSTPILPKIADTVLRIRALLEDGSQQVWDRELEKHRPIRPADVAVLCYTHKRLEYFADALRSLGIRTRLAEDGWFASRIIQIAFHALSWVADPSDDHAALYLTATELGASNLEKGLGALIGGKDLPDPVLDALSPLVELASDTDVPNLVQQVIEALGLYDQIAIWPDAAQARANLLRLHAEAEELADINRDALESGGRYGSGLPTFLSWLKSRVEIKNGDLQPDPRVQDENAVELVTWHAAKGREWPVVVVGGMDIDIGPQLPDMAITYQDFSDLGAILDKAVLDVYPKFHAEETRDKFIEPQMEKSIMESKRLLYVALTRAKEKVILEWPSHREEKGEMTYWGLLKDSAKLEIGNEEMTVAGKTFPCHIITAEKENAEALANGDGNADANMLPQVGRRAIVAGTLPTELTHEAVAPSSLEGMPVSKMPKLTEATYGKPMRVFPELPPMERGLLLHRCFELFSGHSERARNLTSLDGRAMDKATREAIAGAVQNFDDWIAKEWTPVSVDRELPFVSLDTNGSVINGVMDLLVETEEGFWIIDHKSDQTDDEETRFAIYLPQLETYADAVRKARPEKPVLGVGVNWIAEGNMAFKKLDR